MKIPIWEKWISTSRCNFNTAEHDSTLWQIPFQSRNVSQLRKESGFRCAHCSCRIITLPLSRVACPHADTATTSTYDMYHTIRLNEVTVYLCYCIWMSWRHLSNHRTVSTLWLLRFGKKRREICFWDRDCDWIRLLYYWDGREKGLVCIYFSQW